MRPFTYNRAVDLAQAARLGQQTGQGQTDAPVQFLAGGTSLIDLMKLDVLTPERVVDITPLRANHATVQAGHDGLRLGALAKMAAVAAHPAVLADYPVIAQSLQLAASAQLPEHGDAGWQRAAANPQHVFSRSELVCLQQAQPGLRLRGDPGDQP
jgi:xanthine dehydrogenase YagS FAD-binding subunit